MVNAFQEGMQFAQERTRRENREKGIGALADEFGDQALAPQEFQAVRGTDRLDRQLTADEAQRGVENTRADVVEQERADELARAAQLRGSRATVRFYQTGLTNGVPIEEITARAAPALQALGIDPSNFQELNAQITANPDILNQMEAAIRGQSAGDRRAIGRPVAVRLGDGTTGLIQTFSDGTTEQVSGVTPLDQELAGGRLDVARGSLAVKQPDVQGQIAEEKEVGKGRGAVRVEDLPTSRTAVAAQEAKLASGEATAGRAISAIDSAMGEVDGITAGFVGGVTSFIPGTPAFDLVEEILPVVSQEFVANLQNMRDMSKTGGAVGNVSNAEGDKLQALRGSLNTGQSPEQLLKNMQKMKDQILASRALIQDAWVQDQAARAEAAAAGGAAPTGLAVSPEDQALFDKYGIGQP